MTMTKPERFSFAFEPPYIVLARLVGVQPSTAWVEVSDEWFVACFGPWKVHTDRANVVEVITSGPYSVAKTIGPAHLSFSDRGLTFATNNRAGVCVKFRDPVRGMDPLGLIRHPGLTITVADPDALVAALDRMNTVPR
ncbi:MAG: hypothetical protein ABIP03_00925 [Aquihabitans sp.]